MTIRPECFISVYRFGGNKGIIFFGTCQVKERAQAVGENGPCCNLGGFETPKGYASVGITS